MAHMMKFNGSSSTKIIGHCLRQSGKDGLALKYRTNSFIDTEKTHLNISTTISGHGSNAFAYFNDRKNEIGVKRKDQVTLVDWVITLPQELVNYLSYEQQQEFFNACGEFVSDRYGSDNIIGFFQHFDETTPHIHIPVMPIKDGKFQAKNIFTRKDLSTFHTDLDYYLQFEADLSYPMPGGLIVNGATKQNQTTQELRSKTLQAENEQLELKNQALQETLDVNMQSVKDFEEMKELPDPDIPAIPEAKKTPLGFLYKADEYDQLQHSFELIKNNVAAAYHRASELTQSYLKKVNELSLKTVELQEQVEYYCSRTLDSVHTTELEEQLKTLQHKYKNLHDKAFVIEKAELQAENERLSAENERLNNTLGNYTIALSKSLKTENKSDIEAFVDKAVQDNNFEKNLQSKKTPENIEKSKQSSIKYRSKDDDIEL